MSLITDLFAHPIDEGYAEAARRRPAASDTSPGGKATISPALILGLLALGLLLGTAALQVRQDAGVVSAERESLVERIDLATAHADALERDARRARARHRRDRGRQQNSRAVGNELRDSIAVTQGATGTRAVTGPGVVVEIDNAESGDGSGSSSVLDLDVQQVVNGLWAAGAEAVAVNGQRVTALTAIRSANDVILVNFRPLNPPYRGQRDRRRTHAWQPVPGGSRRRLVARCCPIRRASSSTFVTRHRSPCRLRARRCAWPNPRSLRDTGHRPVARHRRRAAARADVPLALQPYLPIAVVAALDAVFGGIRAGSTGSSTTSSSSSRSSPTCWSPRSSSTWATSSASAASSPPASSSCSACASSATWRPSAATCSGPEPCRAPRPSDRPSVRSVRTDEAAPAAAARCGPTAPMACPLGTALRARPRRRPGAASRPWSGCSASPRWCRYEQQRRRPARRRPPGRPGPDPVRPQRPRASGCEREIARAARHARRELGCRRAAAARRPLAEARRRGRRARHPGRHRGGPGRGSSAAIADPHGQSAARPLSGGGRGAARRRRRGDADRRRRGRAGRVVASTYFVDDRRRRSWSTGSHAAGRRTASP